MNGFKLYDWMPFFAAVRDKLLVIGESPTDERDRQMNELAESLYVELGGNPPILNKIYWPVNPFTFVYSLASRHASKTLSKRDFYEWVVEKMELTASAPTDRIFPAPRPDSVIMGDAGTYQPLDSAGVDETWRIFKIVAKATRADNLSNADYKKFLDINMIAIRNSTQSMFLLNPKLYLPLDDTGVLGLLHAKCPNEWQKSAFIKQQIKNGKTNLHDVLKKIMDIFPELKPCQINLFGFIRHKQLQLPNPDELWRIEYYARYRREIERIGARAMLPC